MAAKSDASIEEDQTGASDRRSRGEFVRGVSSIRPALGEPGIPAEKDRYHLIEALLSP